MQCIPVFRENTDLKEMTNNVHIPVHFIILFMVFQNVQHEID